MGEGRGEGPLASYPEIISEARRRAARNGIAFHAHSLSSSKEVAVCYAMPIHNLFVAADGGVFPCPHLGVPVDPIPRIFHGDRYEVARRPFGSLTESGLPEVWGREEYRAFRRSFRDRRNLGVRGLLEVPGDRPPAAETAACRKLVSQSGGTRPPLPAACRNCYMARGL